MDAAEYWLMAWEYGIWNATIESLQFWAEDLNPITLGIASEHVYTHFLWTSSTLHQLSDEILFGCFVVALNSAFHQQLSLADEGYESGSNEDLPTSLWKTPHIHHVSTLEHASFNPVCSTPCWPVDPPHYDTQSSPLRPVHHHLSFSSDQDPDTSLVHMDTPDSSAESAPEPSDNEESYEDEDFQTVSLDDEHLTTEMVPERTFFIHENGLPNNVSAYPCPSGSNNTTSYIDSLDLSDVSDLEDHFLTTSDEEELPGLEEVPY